ncbi:hypothetical protein ACF08B_40855 [Streptomyces sp. NPDC015139]|uniref:hypothetical protein n=1 Tax=Streptomyces sp. NPDC015139 TaxID=3364942 RepID=UPI0036F4D74A
MGVTRSAATARPPACVGEEGGAEGHEQDARALRPGPLDEPRTSLPADTREPPLRQLVRNGRLLRTVTEIDARWYGTSHQKGVIDGAPEFHRRLDAFEDVHGLGTPSSSHTSANRARSRT